MTFPKFQNLCINLRRCRFWFLIDAECEVDNELAIADERYIPMYDECNVPKSLVGRIL
jgi:hypothetical protein